MTQAEKHCEMLNIIITYWSLAREVHAVGQSAAMPQISVADIQRNLRCSRYRAQVIMSFGIELGFIEKADNGLHYFVYMPQMAKILGAWL